MIAVILISLGIGLLAGAALGFYTAHADIERKASDRAR